MKNRIKLQLTAIAAVIAALYVVLTYVAAAFGLSSGAIQIRLSEVLTVMPVFTVAAVPGLFIGCLLANILTGCALWDVVFGSIATLIGAVGTYLLRKHRVLALIPPIASNTVIVPLVLMYVYTLSGTLPYFCATVALGEIISAGLLGALLMKTLEKSKISFPR